MFVALMHFNFRAKRKLEFQEILFWNVYIRMLLERKKNCKIMSRLHSNFQRHLVLYLHINQAKNSILKTIFRTLFLYGSKNFQYNTLFSTITNVQILDIYFI